MVKGKDVWGTWLQRDMEERQIGNRTVYTFSKMKNSFYEMLCDTATKYPDKIGIVDNWNREYTYQKFLVMVNQLAAYMKHILKVEKGNHIGLLLNNGIEFATAIYAVCKLGAVAVPLPTKYREPEIQSLVKKADLKFIFVSEDYKVWTSFYTECGIKVILTENEKTEYGFTYLAMQKEKEESGEGELEDEVILMFTSGTTSTSKGVILKNYNINHAVMIYQRILEQGCFMNYPWADLTYCILAITSLILFLIHWSCKKAQINSISLYRTFFQRYSFYIVNRDWLCLETHTVPAKRHCHKSSPSFLSLYLPDPSRTLPDAGCCMRIF